MVQEIKALRSAVAQRDKERAERATLVQQEKLVRGKVGGHQAMLGGRGAGQGEACGSALGCDAALS